MFPDSFWFNFSVFAVGQAVAWGWLRTGMVARGVALLIGLLVLADAALVARLAYRETGFWFLLPLLAMQAWALVDTGLFAFGRWRRTRADVVARRDAAFREAMIAHLGDDRDRALEAYRSAMRLDPWDPSTRLAYATSLASSGDDGDRRRALRQLHRAQALDGDGRFREVVTGELRRYRADGRRPAKVS